MEDKEIQQLFHTIHNSLDAAEQHLYAIQDEMECLERQGKYPPVPAEEWQAGNGGEKSTSTCCSHQTGQPENTQDRTASAGLRRIQARADLASPPPEWASIGDTDAVRQPGFFPAEHRGRLCDQAGRRQPQRGRQWVVRVAQGKDAAAGQAHHRLRVG